MPRAGLSYDVVIAEAARQADETGFSALSLVGIARHFGVAVPSLYKHVGGLEAVRRGIAILALGELGEALGVASARPHSTGGRSRLHAAVHAYRAYAVTHPGRYAATIRAAQTNDAEHAAAIERVMEIVLEILAELGLRGQGAIDGARTFRAAVHGFVALESAGGFGLPRDVDRSFAALVDALEAGLAVQAAGG